MDCLFCKIVCGEIPANIIYQDSDLIAFDDINPEAPQHKIIIPRKHIPTLNDIAEHDPIIAKMSQAAIGLAQKLQIAESGYRILMNCNAEGGQTVYHIHMHLLGGRHMQWPPG